MSIIQAQIHKTELHIHSFENKNRIHAKLDIYIPS